MNRIILIVMLVVSVIASASIFTFFTAKLASENSGGQTPIAATDSMLINAGGITDKQYLEGPTGFLSGSTGYTVGMWIKQDVSALNGTVVSISGDEDRAPVQGGGSEDGNRFLILGSTGNAAYRSIFYQKTWFGDTAPVVSDATIGPAQPNPSNWLFVVYVAEPSGMKVYRSDTNAFPSRWGAEFTQASTLTSFSTHTAPLVIGGLARGPAPRLFGSADVESFDKMYLYSMFFYDGVVSLADLKKHWNPAADTESIGNPSDPMPVQPESVMLTSSPTATLKASWVFAETSQVFTNGGIIVDGTGNGNDLTMKTITGTAWSASNRATGDTP